MPDILIRGLDARAFKRLRARARRHRRSLQNEARLVLEQAARASSEEIAVMLDVWKKRFGGRKFSRSVGLVREDRKR